MLVASGPSGRPVSQLRAVHEAIQPFMTVSASRAILPQIRTGSVVRASLVDRLIATREQVVVITAPAGYGKTTLFGQWGEREARVAYLRLDAGHADPMRLLGHLAQAFAEAGAIPVDHLPVVAAPHGALDVTILDRLTMALDEAASGDEGQPALVMVDDFHVLDGSASRDALAWFIDRLPRQVRLALAGRTKLGHPLARLRAERRVLEVDRTDLAMGTQEVLLLAAGADVTITTEEADALIAETEGWPVAIYLALRARASDVTAGRPRRPFRGSAHTIAEYMRDELVSPLDAETQTWLTRSAVLEQMTGPSCDRVTGTIGSLRRLRELERVNQLVIPVDDDRTTFRFHHLFRELLCDALETREPGASARLGIEAARWHEEQGDPVQALDHAHRAGDLDELARLIERYGVALHQRGLLDSLSRWLQVFDRDGLRDRYAGVAVVGAWSEALHGHTAQAMTWLAAAEQAPDRGPMADGSITKAAWVAGVRMGMMPAGIKAFQADVDAVLAGLSATGPMVVLRLHAPVLRGLVEGDLEAAERGAAHGLEVALGRHLWPAAIILNGLRASVALRRGDLGLASAQVSQGLRILEQVQLRDYVTSGPLLAAAARVAVAEGRLRDARDHIAAVSRLRPQLTAALPLLAVMVRVDTIAACLALGEWGAARALNSEITEIASIRPDLGALVEEIERVSDRVRSLRGHAVGPWTLTSAELRLLAYLPTHLTFREIAERMHLSPHTIKTQAMSIYGKLEASSRREALERAVEVGLLAPSVLRMTDGSVGVA